MSGIDRPRDGTTMLLSSLLSLAIVLALLAAVIALTRQPGDAVRELANALGLAALVHLCAALAIQWSRRAR